MAGGEVDYKQELQEIQNILWGRVSSNETFRRWAQGFVFSKTEGTALEQRSGGPCAILAPVQAYMLKYIISSNKPDEFKKLTKSDQESLLVQAMVDILMQCTKRAQNQVVTLLYRETQPSDDSQVPPASDFNATIAAVCTNAEPIASTSDNSQKMVTSDIEVSQLDLPDVPQVPDVLHDQDQRPDQVDVSIKCDLKNQPAASELIDGDVAIDSSDPKDSSFEMKNVPKPPNSPPEIIHCSTSESVMIEDCHQSPGNQQLDADVTLTMHEENTDAMVPHVNDKTLWDVESLEKSIQPKVYETPAMFHRSLRVVRLLTQAEVEAFLQQHIEQLQGEYGILLFLYSVLMTKGIQDLKSEIGDLSEPLIHEVYGYGSQSLVNLMLTGRAVQHVWDNDQDVGGLTLKGIDQQSEIGFVTLMEHMRYCTVGMFYKNPKFPIWVLGSETHLTVAFSFDSRLVTPEQPWETARRIFRRYDPDGSNFIPFGLLQDLLQSLGLVSDPEYVEVMRQKLDSENLGIVLLSNFLDEFYPDMKSLVPETFTLWHYNGLVGSHHKNNVQYIKGHAVLLECDIKAGSEFDQVLTCLQTKWPNVEIQWETANNKPPSLN